MSYESFSPRWIYFDQSPSITISPDRIGWTCVLEEKEDQLWKALQMHSDLTDEAELQSTKLDQSHSEELEDKIRSVSNTIFKLRKEINEARKVASQSY